MMAEVLTLDRMQAEEELTLTMCSWQHTKSTHPHLLASLKSNVVTKVRIRLSHFCLVIMPESALHDLSRIHTSYPMTFMMQNAEMGLKTYCGNLEFIAQEGTCNIPIWMMNLLCLEEGSDVIIRSVNLRKGSYIKFQPHETAFIDIPGFKEM